MPLWETFGDEWQKSCATAGLSKPFHMKDLAARRGEFEAWGEKQGGAAAKTLEQLATQGYHFPTLPAPFAREKLHGAVFGTRKVKS